MNQISPLQKTLHEQYEALRKRNPSYSIRAFSRKIGVAPGTLSLIMLGKRNISDKMALKIANNLKLGPQDRSEILSRYLDKKLIKAPKAHYQELSQDQYQIVSDWKYLAILNLIKTKDFQSDDSWIASRLGLKKTEVSSALERLERLGMIKYNEEGTLVRTRMKFRTPDEIVIAALKASHHETLDLAHQSIDRDSINDRDMTSVTFPMNKEKIAEAKALIRKFEDDLVDLMEQDENPDEVYRIAIQFFPLTKLNRTK